jgi:hypothetical protein
VQLDYAALTDALVWSYVLVEVGISENKFGHILAAVAKLVPLARCYQRPDELGYDYFRLECYFMTHLLYVFSDWGQHTLNRQMFSEEFEFILMYMNFAMKKLKVSLLFTSFAYAKMVSLRLPNYRPLHC